MSTGSDATTPTCQGHGQPPEPVFSDQEFERAASMFRAAGDPERLRILELLSRGERCVSEIVEACGANTSTVSQRLLVLRTGGLVVRRRQGRHIWYRLADAHVQQLVLAALSHSSHA